MTLTLLFGGPHHGKVISVPDSIDEFRIPDPVAADHSIDAMRYTLHPTTRYRRVHYMWPDTDVLVAEGTPDPQGDAVEALLRSLAQPHFPPRGK